jgi:hypothetical protein
MKGRNSLHKANWSLTRELDYKQMCQQILFDRKEEINISENNVFLIADGKEEFLMAIEDEKTTWYKIWCRLKYGW